MKELNIKPHKSVGDRFVAGLIDYAIIFGFFIYFAYTFGEPNGEGGYTVSGLPALIPMGFWAIMTVGLEQFFNATLGNLIIGIKPVSLEKTNTKPSFSQSLKRHLLDPVDMFFFGFIGYILIKNTQHNQRVGNIWAKTVVVKV